MIAFECALCNEFSMLDKRTTIMSRVLQYSETVVNVIRQHVDSFNMPSMILKAKAV